MAAVDHAVQTYWQFFEGFNQRDAQRWAAALHFPHVRVSPRGPAKVLLSADQLADEFDFTALQASGWQRSVGVAPTLIHEGEDHIHLQGGWTRFNAAGEAIISNEVTYILTRVNQHWGIQARFGIDAQAAPRLPFDRSGAERAVEEYINAWNSRDFPLAAYYANYPLTQVEAGAIRQWQTANEFAKSLQQGPWHWVTIRSLRALQSGPNAINLALEVSLDGGTRIDQAIFLVIEHDGHWGVQARSIIERAG